MSHPSILVMAKAVPSPIPPASPFERVREAFAELNTFDKSAFVVEAAFETIGEAVGEAGRSLSDMIESLDIERWFTAPPATPPPPAAAPPSA